MLDVRAVFFDIGDTLVFDRPDRQERFRLACLAAGLPCPESLLPAAFAAGESYAVSRYLAGEEWESEAVMRAAAQLTFDFMGSSGISDAEWPRMRDAFLSIPWARNAHPDAMRILTDLHSRGFIVGAISDWEETLGADLAELGLMQNLDVLAVSSIVGARKPDPRLFHEGLRKAGVTAASAIHIGDWYELDVVGARAAGMTAVLSDARRRRPEADCRRVETFAELSQYLCDLPNPA